MLFLIFTRRNRPKNTAGASYMENFQDIQAIVKVKKNIDMLTYILRDFNIEIQGI